MLLSENGNAFTKSASLENRSFTDAERDQIWAEAKHIWESGEKLYLENDLIRSAEEAQREAMEVDERQGMVEEYLDILLPTDWDERDIYKRRDFVREYQSDPTQPKGTVRREFVSNAELWVECFGRNLAELKPSDSYSLAALMSKVDGWERAKSVKKLLIYGRQRLYVRKCSNSNALCMECIIKSCVNT